MNDGDEDRLAGWCDVFYPIWISGWGIRYIDLRQVAQYLTYITWFCVFAGGVFLLYVFYSEGELVFCFSWAGTLLAYGT